MSVLHELVEAGRRLDARGWVPATSGNLSARDPGGVWITASGKHKGLLAPEDFLRLDEAGRPPPGRRASAETALHLGLYRRDPGCGAVLHTHSVNATVLSRLHPEGVTFEGHEIVKAFPGVQTHEGAHGVPVFGNDQDVDRLWARVAEAPLPLPGFLIAGHGLYAFGATVADALRHVEAFEHLFACVVLESRLRSAR
jgi:methylthioribulose-1-phosphate dehydratase